MRSIVLSAFLILLTAACASPNGTGPQENLNILVMGSGVDQTSVPRNSSAFKRIQNALAEELQNAGFRVYDETALALGAQSQSNARRTDAEMIDMARSIVHPPIDVIVVYGLYGDVQDKGYARKLTSRVSGRMLTVHSGQRLGNFEVSLPSSISISANCDGVCLNEALGKSARELASEAGAVLAVKLRDLASPSVRSVEPSGRAVGSQGGLESTYVLAFDGFSANELGTMEDHITHLSSNTHLRLLRSGLSSSKYWYETSSNEAYLLRSLRLLVDDMGISATLRYSGNTFRMTKISQRKVRN